MDKIQAVMGRFPQHAYNPEDTTTALYKLIQAFISEFNTTVDNIDRLEDILSIDTVQADDLYNRYGALLNLPRNAGETAEQYRDRLRVSVTALSGGTADAIQYAIACGLGINSDNDYKERIKVYDAWEYTGTEPIEDDYGYVVCTVDLGNEPFSSDIEQIVNTSANNVKAAGVIIQLIYKNYRIIYYSGLDDIVYASLDTLEYNKVGE